MYGQPAVIIEPYDPTWPSKFEAEKGLLASALEPWLAGPIEHVGSTAVPDLPAKPIIDIMVAVTDLRSSASAIVPLEQLHYCYYEYKAEQMHWFCKPSPLVRTHHLTLIPWKSQLWHDRLAFRDRLRCDAVTRRCYAELKIALAAKYKDDREAYTDAKTDFIQSVLRPKPKTILRC